jgi:transposase-like protein
VSRRYRKAEQWRELIAMQEAGTESVVEFCRRHGLAPKSFYHRRKALRDADQRKGMVAVSPPLPRAPSGPIALSWRGVELTVSGSASATWVAQLMRELADAPVS